MTDVSIRIDAETARLVAELAHLMERPKKAVMADAIAGYAQARLPALANGRLRYGGLPPLERLRLRRDELLRTFEEQGSTNVRVLDPPMPARPGNVLLTDENASEDVCGTSTGIGSGTSTGSGSDTGTGSGSDTGTGDAFGDPAMGNTAFGSHRETITLLAETDIFLGGEAESMMEELARQLLGMPVEVISMTKLALFSPERLERLVAESTPL